MFMQVMIMNAMNRKHRDTISTTLMILLDRSDFFADQRSRLIMTMVCMRTTISRMKLWLVMVARREVGGRLGGTDIITRRIMKITTASLGLLAIIR